MSRRFRGGSLPGQAYLLPPDVRDWLPPRHLAWALLELAREMDLSGFASWYRADGQGRPAYDPGLMVTLIGYCYCKGIRSSRAVEAATFDDLGARVICGNLHPDHSTIARFLGRHEDAVKALLVWSVTACAREGLVSVDVVAGDGTKVKASASVSSNATAGRLAAEIGALEKLIAAEVNAWIEQARAEDAADGGDGDGEAAGGDGTGGPGRQDPGPGGQGVLFGGGGPGQAGPAGGLPGLALAKAADKLARRRQALARLEAEARARRQAAEAAREQNIARLAERAERRQAAADALAARADARVAEFARKAAAKAAAGSARRPRGPVPVPAGRNVHVAKARHIAERAWQALAAAVAAPVTAPEPATPPRASSTDCSARPMPLKNGGFGMAHNVQALACPGQVILAITRHDSPQDMRALHPLLRAGRANLNAAGITAKISTALFDAGYASDDNFTAACEPDLYVAVRKEARQTGRLNDGKKPATMKPSWTRMAARLDTPAGQALYKQRAAIIEPVFAQLFARLGQRLNYRDGKADLELHLWAATHNMLKAIRARQRAAPA
jgi:transposase